MTTTVDTSIEVNLPVRTVYNQWTQFAEFPHFMGGVQSVTQLGDDRMHWVAEIAGVKREWDARVLEQVPDQRVAWAATEGATNAGAVTFEDLGGRTRVNLFLEYEPEGVVEKVGDALDVVERQAKGDLERFKAFVESEGYATGAWRGTVAGEGHVGTPGVEHAAASRGDDGKAGVSGKAVAAGVGVAAAAAAVAAGAVAAGRKDDADEVPVTPAPVETQPVDTQPVDTQPVDTAFDATEAPATPVASVDPLDPAPLPPGTAGVRTDGMDDPTGAGRTDA
ncbi:SRPBCC family protein [Microlunatus capsulatus]|uniref:Carbon monoxide dehydrogenase subunit G n=1 Tax=Microlunatus capsulatus TaxID=99117 RepID=A0ABS4Z5R2_9ACTN|nr:SRPBCC family protein [Microlunatus capsulatus]MBP2416377.1 carbon monoxide dehydrogenase subunit G [Microlunatus capsulatus]